MPAGRDEIDWAYAEEVALRELVSDLLENPHTRLSLRASETAGP